jgi:hypothetical protein
MGYTATTEIEVVEMARNSGGRVVGGTSKQPQMTTKPIVAVPQDGRGLGSIAPKKATSVKKGRGK